MASKRSHGPASHAVKISRGADPTPLHFYSTNYSSHYGNRPASADLRERPARTRGTGYSANFRPAVYYSSSADLRDNPLMLKVLADNYTSLTTQHFRGFPREADRHGQLQFSPAPERVRNGGREELDYVKLRPPTSDPNFMSSETKSMFIAKPFRDRDLESSCHTLREETGFTHAQNTEPITFRPPQAFYDLSPLAGRRPTGQSVTKRDFTQHFQTTGKEGIPLLTERADESNGYVKGSIHQSLVQPRAKEMVGYTFSHELPSSLLIPTSRQDPAHFSTITHPHHFSSYTHHVLEAGQRKKREGLRRVERERKELTGYSENNLPLPRPRPVEGGHFSTHYTSHFPRPHPQVGGVASRYPTHNGFSRGTQVHGFTESRSVVTLPSMHPSQARWPITSPDTGVIALPPQASAAERPLSQRPHPP